MTDADRSDFDRSLLAVAASYNRALTEDVLNLYWGILKDDLTLGEFTEAVQRHLRDADRGRRFPVVADILCQNAASKPAAWRVAWGLIVQTMEDYGAHESVLFTDQIATAVVRSMGGWIALCRADLNEPWTERKFESTYKEFAAAGVKTVRYLPGIFEAENRSRGYAVAPPRVIGDVNLLPEPEQVDEEARRMIQQLPREGAT